MQLLVLQEDKDAGAVARQHRGGGRKRSPALKHLESEGLTALSAEVARFWQDAYDELVKMEEQLLAKLEKMLPRLSPAARREAELTDLPMINDHLQTFKYRRAHWRGRLEQLNGHTSRRRNEV